MRNHETAFLRPSLESFHMVAPAEQLQQVQKTAPLPDEFSLLMTETTIISIWRGSPAFVIL